MCVYMRIYVCVCALKNRIQQCKEVWENKTSKQTAGNRKEEQKSRAINGSTDNGREGGKLQLPYGGFGAYGRLCFRYCTKTTASDVGASDPK